MGRQWYQREYMGGPTARLREVGVTSWLRRRAWGREVSLRSASAWLLCRRRRQEELNNLRLVRMPSLICSTCDQELARCSWCGQAPLALAGVYRARQRYRYRF